VVGLRGGALSLRANFGWTVVGTGVYSACRWLTIAVMAKLLPVTDVGLYTLAAAIAAPVFVLTNMELRVLIVTDVRHQHAVSDYLGVRISTACAGLAICFAIAAIAGYSLPVTEAVMLSASVLVLDGVSDILFGYMQQSERMDGIARSMMLRGLLRLAVFAGAVYVTRRLLLGMVAEVASTLLVLLAHDLPTARALRRALNGPPLLPRWRLETLRSIARSAAALAALVFVLSVQSQLPRYFIEWACGTASLGIFAALAAFASIVSPLSLAMGQAITPRLAKAADTDRPRFLALRRRLVLFNAALGAGGALVAALAGPLLLRYAYTAQYAEHSAVLVWIFAAVAAGYIASAYGVSFSASRYFVHLLYVQVAGTLVLALAAWIATPRFGLVGAAGAMVVQGLFSAVICSLLSARLDRRRAAPAP
jgi:O-antigen/teichoic acid export membrane protein